MESELNLLQISLSIILPSVKMKGQASMLYKVLFLLTFFFQIQAQSGAAFSPQFAKVLKSALSREVSLGARGRVTTQNQVEPRALIGSDKIFRGMGKLIVKARENIYLQTWKFDPESKPAKILARSLKKLSSIRKQENQTQPIHFWLLVNITKIQSLTREVNEINDYISKNKLNNKYVKVHLGVVEAAFLDVNHAKTLSVDDQSAVITGANISNNFNGKGMYDLGFIVHGEIAGQINRDFTQYWKKNVGAINIIPPLSHPPSINNSNHNLPILFTKTRAKKSLSSRIQKSSLTNAIIQSIRSAKKSISLITPNLNVPLVMQELVRAASDKVVVRIILSQRFEEALEVLPTRGGANFQNVERMYRSLGWYRDKEYFCNYLDIRWYSDNGIDSSVETGAPNSHAKYLVIDDQVTYIGSANMDMQSWVNSREIGLFIDSSKISKAWKKQAFRPVFQEAIRTKQCGGPLSPRETRQNEQAEMGGGR